MMDVQQVNKSFGNEQVLKNVSLQMEKGKLDVRKLTLEEFV